MKRAVAQEWFGMTLAGQLLTAVALSLAAVSVRIGLAPWLGEHHEFLPGYLAVAAATWLGTWRAGILVAGASLAAINSTLFAAPPVLAPWVQDAASLIAFAVVSSLLMYLTHHAARRMHVLRDEVTRLDDVSHKKSDFLALIAHELRNPLSAICSAAGLIKSGRLDGGGLRGTWEAMERQTNHMQRLIGDLLDVARIEQGKITLQCQRTKIAVLLEQCVADARGYTATRGQEVVIYGNSDCGDANIDSLRIGQVLGNLLHNASKFSPEGAVITVEVRTTQDLVVVVVRDNGRGIPASQLSAIFDSFVQLETPSVTPQGLGLGLALCKRLVEMHGGSIAAHSAGVGLGAEFVVTMPRALPPEPTVVSLGSTATALEVKTMPLESTAVPLDEAAADLAPRNEVSAEGTGAGLRIMVVDDNRDAAESLATLLGLSGHHSSTAADGQSALMQAERDRPDFVFLDIGLPDMSGHEVAMRLRQNRSGRQPILVALTGRGSDEDRRMAERSGFDAHLTKPVSMDQIEQALLLQAPAQVRAAAVWPRLHDCVA